MKKLLIKLLKFCILATMSFFSGGVLVLALIIYPVWGAIKICENDLDPLLGDLFKWSKK